MLVFWEVTASPSGINENLGGILKLYKYPIQFIDLFTDICIEIFCFSQRVIIHHHHHYDDV